MSVRDINNLAPCPFCGGKAAVEVKKTDSDSVSVYFAFQISCKSCGAFVPNSISSIAISLHSDGTLDIRHDEREKAFEAWNRRVSE